MDAISRKTLLKYMHKIRDSVTATISEILPEQFVIEFDGWSDGFGSYVVAVFAVFPNSEGNTEHILLGIEPLLKETSHSAQSHVDYFRVLLSNFGKSEANVLCLVCDNAYVNKAIGRAMKVPTIACKAHLLQLFINNIYLKDKEEIVEKIHAIMVKLKSTIFLARLDEIGCKHPVLSNVTRWSSTYKMVKRYVEISPYLKELTEAQMDEPKEKKELSELKDMLLSDAEMESLETCLIDLQYFNQCSKFLQRRDCTLLEARVVFNMVLTNYHFANNPQNYLSARSDCVKCQNFENGVISLQSGKDPDAVDIPFIKGLLIKAEAPNDTLEGFDDSFIKEVKKGLKRARSGGPDIVKKYRKTDFIPATSSEVERLFSKAKFIRTSLRCKMDLENFECLLYLYYNQNYWNKDTVAKILHA